MQGINRSNSGPGKVISRNFSTWRAARQAWEFGYNLLVACTPKTWESQKRQKIRRKFWTTWDFDREYLRNGLRYRQAKNGDINCNPFYVDAGLFDFALDCKIEQFM